MNNLSISGWANLAISSLPEPHHSSIKQIAKYAIEWQVHNRLSRKRRPSITKASEREIPMGFYDQGSAHGTYAADDKFFAQLQFMYRLGWIAELDKGSLVLEVGESHSPAPRVPASRRRDGIVTKKRFAIYERDAFTCWICGIKTLGLSEMDYQNPWSPSLDHVLPHSQGGSDHADNLMTSHRWCNTVRGDREFSRQIMCARVIHRQAVAEMLWEALEEGWDFPKSDIQALPPNEAPEFRNAMRDLATIENLTMS